MGDVVVTTNLFGDILSDESSQVVGGLGMAQLLTLVILLHSLSQSNYKNY